MDYKYYKSAIKPNTWVSFKFLDENNRTIEHIKDTACYSRVTYGQIPANCKKIVTYKSINKIPYDIAIIKKWVAELCEMGFPVSVKGNKIINFIVDLDKYQYKAQINVVLSLIRMLFESYICYSVEYYFEILEKNPTVDKFIALQDSLRQLGRDADSSYYNSNHCCTGKFNGDNNVTKDEFIENVKETKSNVYEGYSCIDCLFYKE